MAPGVCGHRPDPRQGLRAAVRAVRGQVPPGLINAANAPLLREERAGSPEL